MDPLSIAASVIALTQASGAIGKSLAFLHSLCHIPDDFCNLVNEVSTLQAVLEQVKDALKQCDHGEPKMPSILALELNTMKALKDDLNEAVGGLDALCSRLDATSKSLDEAGRTRISKRMWLREKSNIAKIRTRTNTAREHLTLCFGALISSQT